MAVPGMRVAIEALCEDKGILWDCRPPKSSGILVPPFQSGQSSFLTATGPLNSPVRGAFSSVEYLDLNEGGGAPGPRVSCGAGGRTRQTCGEAVCVGPEVRL